MKYLTFVCSVTVEATTSPATAGNSTTAATAGKTSGGGGEGILGLDGTTFIILVSVSSVVLGGMIVGCIFCLVRRSCSEEVKEVEPEPEQKPKPRASQLIITHAQTFEPEPEEKTKPKAMHDQSFEYDN